MQAPGHSSHFLHPDRVKSLRLASCCQPVSLLLLMLVVELMAVLISVLRAEYYPFLSSLAFLTMYYQLVLFLAVGPTCHLSGWLARLPVPSATLVVSALTACSALLTALALRSWVVEYTPSFETFLLQSQLSCQVLVLFLLRYQYLLQQRYQQLAAQINARLEALQAYIKPHFLFNALNNLAAMISIDGKKAEELVLAMARMLRYVLRAQSMVNLREEVEFIQHYLLIEQARLGDRLEVRWQAPSPVDETVFVPAMVFQPLLENAISHGPATLTEGGAIEIELSYSARDVRLLIRNHAPVAARSGSEAGHHRISIDNIRARLELLYDGQARFVCGEAEAIDAGRVWWSSRLRLPRRIPVAAGFIDAAGGNSPPAPDQD